MQLLFDEMIQRTEVIVAKELTGQIANWQPSSPLIGAKQIILGKISQMFFLRIAVVDDFVNQPQRSLTGNFSAQQLL